MLVCNWVVWIDMHSTHLFARLCEWRDMQLPRYMPVSFWLVRGCMYNSSTCLFSSLCKRWLMHCHKHLHLLLGLVWLDLYYSLLQPRLYQ